MNSILNFIQNRNFILISALIAAFVFPHFSVHIKEYTLYILAVVMTFSTTGIQFKMLKDYKSVFKTTLESVLLNYIIHGAILLIPAYFLFDETIFNGFVVIAATPPGVAIIPFTYTFKGNLDYSFKGILGTYILAVFLAPVIISVFSENTSLDPIIIISVIIKIIVVPILLSRILLIKKIYPITEKIRGKIVDWGFALIIYTAVAINRDIILNDINNVTKAGFILFSSIIIAGILFMIIFRKKSNKELLISKNLMLTVKSSGFAVAVTLILFEEKSAIPAAVMGIVILLWLIGLNIYYFKIDKRN
ncbi:MAG: hypothetical protein L3J35_08340 [Bacteroidales bacterium]|nr:hypothetical protein [Bacteroidales bacterium]